LTEHFQSKYPSFLSAKIIIDPQTKCSKGFGFIKFSSQSEAENAKQEASGSLINGKPIKASSAYWKNGQQYYQDNYSMYMQNTMNPYMMHNNYPYPQYSYQQYPSNGFY
jgi:RNA recognition motif-containing protein